MNRGGKMGRGAGSGKWQPRGATQSSPNTPSVPGGFEDSAVRDFSHRAHEHDATKDDKAKTTTYNGQEGNDSLSNLYQAVVDEAELYEKAGAATVKPTRTGVEAHELIMAQVKKIE